MTEYKRDELCSYVEAGKLLGVSNYTVRDYVERGKLTAVRYGKRPYVLKAELAEFIKPSEWKKIRKVAVASIKEQVTEMQHDKPRETDAMLGALVRGIAI